MITSNSSTIITADNVKCLGEIIAIRALKTYMAYSGKALDDLYYGLIRDIHRSGDINYTFSDGYDLAQTAICFLYEHIGKPLGEETGKYRDGKAVTIKHACYTVINRCIDKTRARFKNSLCIDDLGEAEPAAQFEWYKEDADSLHAKKILRKIKLKRKDKEILSYRLMGYTFLETARILAINASTINNRLFRIRKRYSSLFTCNM